jgi:succinate dehydrogenase / fumarate reductase cytochrome b subunit
MTCAPQVTALPEFEEFPNKTEATVPAPGKTCGCKHHIPVLESAAPLCKCKELRTPRKIHAACGLLLTGFIVLHLGASVTGFNPRIYQQNVDRLHSIVNAIPGVTLFGIILPLLLQGTTGLFLVQREGLKFYAGKCDRGGRARFFLQRWTALVVLAFITVHFTTMHAWGLHLLYRFTQWQSLSRFTEGGLFHSEDAFVTTVQGFTSLWSAGSMAHGANVIGMFLLLGGIWATAFHVANGAWSGALLWKVLPTPYSKQLWKIACIVLGVTLAAAGSIAWYAFTLAPNAVLALAAK